MAERAQARVQVSTTTQSGKAAASPPAETTTPEWSFVRCHRDHGMKKRSLPEGQTIWCATCSSCGEGPERVPQYERSEGWLCDICESQSFPEWRCDRCADAQPTLAHPKPKGAVAGGDRRAPVPHLTIPTPDTGPTQKASSTPLVDRCVGPVTPQGLPMSKPHPPDPSRAKTYAPGVHVTYWSRSMRQWMRAVVQ